MKCDPPLFWDVEVLSVRLEVEDWTAETRWYSRREQAGGQAGLADRYWLASGSMPFPRTNRLVDISGQKVRPGESVKLELGAGGVAGYILE